jgi:hypothetical protein
MINRLKKHYILSSILFIIGVTIARIFYAQSFLLTPDETNYWQWSRHLAWGYHDQTPMIAWAIGFFTYFCGHTELAVRLPSILSMAVASVYLVLIAKHWFSDRVAWHTALLSQSVFVFNVGALLATADGLQGAAWAAAAYHTARGFEDHQRRHWTMGGLWFGFGMLSKYTMVLFLPFVFLFGLTSPIGRKRLATLRPYVGCFLGIVMFLPVVVWNAANNWNSFRHVAYLSGANEGFSFHWKFFGEYIGSQVGLVTPMVFGVICAGWVSVIRHWRTTQEWIFSFLLLTSFPLIAAFAVLSLHTRVYGNWPCAGYLTACVLAAGLWSQPGQKKRDNPSGGRSSRLWRWTVGSAYFLTLLILVHVHWPILPIPPGEDRTINELHGWDQLGDIVAEIRKSMPRPDNSFIFGLQYQMASELAFYVPGQPFTVSINRWNRPNVYDYWWQDNDLMGKDAVGVIGDNSSRARLLEVFEQVDQPVPFVIYAPGTDKNEGRTLVPMKTYYVYRCYVFKGGLRWIPPVQDDIRSGSDVDSSNH